MSMHRLRCRNMNCAYEGLMEAKSTQPMMKKAFREKKDSVMKSRGMSPPVEVMQVRCPKCSTRWRVRADQLR